MKVRVLYHSVKILDEDAGSAVNYSSRRLMPLLQQVIFLRHSSCLGHQLVLLLVGCQNLTQNQVEGNTPPISVELISAVVKNPK